MQQHPHLQEYQVAYSVPFTPRHHGFHMTEHSFLDMEMNERARAIRNKEAYMTFDGYANNFKFEFGWRPDPALIEEWNREWEGDQGFWWNLKPDEQIELLHPRRRYR